MPIEILPDDDILWIQISGTLTKTEAVGTQAKAADITRQRGIKKVFIDARGAEFSISTTENFRFTASFADVFACDVRHAIVLSPGDRDHEQIRFGEVVAANRGVPFRMFTNAEAACRWLHGPVSI